MQASGESGCFSTEISLCGHGEVHTCLTTLDDLRRCPFVALPCSLSNSFPFQFYLLGMGSAPQLCHTQSSPSVCSCWPSLYKSIGIGNHRATTATKPSLFPQTRSGAVLRAPTAGAPHRAGSPPLLLHCSSPEWVLYQSSGCSATIW